MLGSGTATKANTVAAGSVTEVGQEETAVVTESLKPLTSASGNAEKSFDVSESSGLDEKYAGKISE